MTQELSEMTDAKIEKISQPTREILVLTLRHRSGNKKLLLSANAAAPKVHFTEAALENPQAAPMFCMLLRKRLGGGRLLRVEQLELDRVLTLVFGCTDELGDKVELRLVCEIMGRHSNIILVDQDGKIIEAIRRVDFVTSEVRQILPGMRYTPPPAQDKQNLLEEDPAQAAEIILAGRDIPLSKALLEHLQGLSPMVCREVSYRVCGEKDPTVGSLDRPAAGRLKEALAQLTIALAEGGGVPCLVRNPQGVPQDYAYLEMTQYGAGWPVEYFDSYSQLVDTFYSGRDAAEEMKSKSASLHKHLVTLRERQRRKILAQQEELLTSEGRETAKQYGDIISANLYGMKKGDTVLRTVNFFDPDGAEVDIPLDPLLAPAQNAQKYYAKYRKAATAEEKLRTLLAQGQMELDYLDSVLAQLERAADSQELEGIREELVSQGYLRGQQRGQQRLQQRLQEKAKKPLRLLPLRFLSSDGYTILCGRNNLQNDQLTLREAKGNDLWLHTQKIHGSHVIVLAQKQGETGGDPTKELDHFPTTTIEEAAMVAACYSVAGNKGGGAKVPVDYTLARYVKKPGGGRPGMVVYDPYWTILVSADFDRVKALLEKG